MNNLFRFLLVLLPICAGLPVQAKTFEEKLLDSLHILPPSGVEEGTSTTIPMADVQDLRKWADNSQQELKDLLHDTASERPALARLDLLSGIGTVVERSSTNKRGRELFMRMELNRGLKVVAILDRHLDMTQPGSVDLEVRFLRRSVNEALGFYQSDIEFIDGKITRVDTMGTAPAYASFGMSYAALSRVLFEQVVDGKAQEEIAIFTIGLLQWDLNRDDQRYVYASAILGLHEALDALAKHSDSSVEASVENMRQLRRVLNRAFERVEDAKTALGQELKRKREIAEQERLAQQRIQEEKRRRSEEAAANGGRAPYYQIGDVVVTDGDHYEGKIEKIYSEGRVLIIFSDGIKLEKLVSKISHPIFKFKGFEIGQTVVTKGDHYEGVIEKIYKEGNFLLRFPDGVALEKSWTLLSYPLTQVSK